MRTVEVTLSAGNAQAAKSKAARQSQTGDRVMLRKLRCFSYIETPSGVASRKGHVSGDSSLMEKDGFNRQARLKPCPDERLKARAC